MSLSWLVYLPLLPVMHRANLVYRIGIDTQRGETPERVGPPLEGGGGKPGAREETWRTAGESEFRFGLQEIAATRE